MRELIFSGVNPEKIDNALDRINSLHFTTMFPLLSFFGRYGAKHPPIVVETRERIQDYVERRHRVDFKSAYRLQTYADLPAELTDFFSAFTPMPINRYTRAMIAEKMQRGNPGHSWYLVRTNPLGESRVLCMPDGERKPVADIALFD